MLWQKVLRAYILFNTMKTTSILALLLTLTSAGSAFGQQKVFNWLPANDESVRLDPAFYHNGRTYRPGPQGCNIHVEIEAQQPVTIALIRPEEWNEATQHPEAMARLRYLCLQEHIVRTIYLCDLPPEPMVLIIHDERNTDRAIFAGLGTVLTGHGGVVRQFVSPNDVHIQYYRWACVENCYPPEFRWIRQAKEKYALTSILKVYGGLTPERDGEQVSVKIKSPVPMAVAILPSKIADQLHGKPEMFESALEKSSCQQRGVQSLRFECAFNVADGPQSLVVMPESAGSIPAHKKAEIEVTAAKCVANCATTTGK